MKAKMLEYNIMKSRKMSVLHVLVYLRMMPIQLSGLNVPTKTVSCRVFGDAYVCIACEPCLFNL